MYTKEDLKNQLAQMGIKPSDNVLIHTSFKAVGQVEGGPEAFIDAFCEYLTDGMFIVPTHTWVQVTPDNPVFNVKTTAADIGLIPKTASLRSDGVRSLHPTHSMWAWGKGADEYVRGEELANSPTTVGFCWDKMAEAGVKILLIGVDNTKNTFIHAIDEQAKLPDRLGNDFDTYTVIDYNGNPITCRHHPLYCSRTEDISWFYGNFEKPLVEMGVQTFGKFGNAVVRKMDAMAARELILKIYSRATEDIFPQHIEIPETLYKD